MGHRLAVRGLLRDLHDSTLRVVGFRGARDLVDPISSSSSGDSHHSSSPSSSGVRTDVSYVEDCIRCGSVVRGWAGATVVVRPDIFSLHVPEQDPRHHRQL